MIKAGIGKVESVNDCWYHMGSKILSLRPDIEMLKLILQRRHLVLHLFASVLLFALFASLDTYLTLTGMAGDVSLEGNPLMQFMMVYFGLMGGLIIEKSLVFLFALIIAVLALIGIDKKADWVYYLALTTLTRNWMKRKKRYWVAFVPLDLVALAQGIAALSWVYLLGTANGVGL